MHKSIRLKLLFNMTISIILFAVLLFGFNTLFAEKYYTMNKKNTLIQSGQKLSSYIKGKNLQEEEMDEELVNSIRILEKSIGGTIVIGTEEGTIYYPNENGPNHSRKDFMPSHFMDEHGIGLKVWEKYNANSVFYKTKDPNLGIDTLRLQVKEKDGLVLLIWVPMAGISENVALSNNFTAIIGIITILITGIWSFFVSGKFTKPIKEMNKITKQMSSLNFSKTLDVNGRDELGELSHSINQLSYSLDNAINELNNKNKQLEQDIIHERMLDKMRKEFVSNVSHELKTPIFLIQGYAEGLKDNIAEDEARRAFYCDVIMEESEKMNILVKDLLDLSHIESGMFSIRKTDFNLNSLIQSILSKYEQVFMERNFGLITEIEDGIMVYADKVRVEQVIVNYINNAINYANDKRVIKIGLKRNADVVRISVYNSSSPIPEEDIDNIWTSFYKVDKARTREMGGTGLGLSIVRAIQEAHQNQYGVQNVEGGVVFWCEFSQANKAF